VGGLVVSNGAAGVLVGGSGAARATGVLVGGSGGAGATEVLVGGSGGAGATEVLVGGSGGAGVLVGSSTAAVAGVPVLCGMVSVCTTSGRKIANGSGARSEATADERVSGSLFCCKDGVADKRGGKIAVLLMSRLIVGDRPGRGVGHSANKLPVVGAGRALLFWALLQPNNRHIDSNRPIIM